MTPVLSKDPEKEPGPPPVSFRPSSEELIDEIDTAAKALGISRNKAINQLLRYALDAHQKEARKAKK